MSGKLVSYRARKACREEYNELRAQLHKLKDTEWQRAGIVMMRIAELLGHRYGSMGGRIEPRACKFCRYYGHTKQWCPKRKVMPVFLALRARPWIVQSAEAFHPMPINLALVHHPGCPHHTLSSKVLALPGGVVFRLAHVEIRRER